MALYKALVAGGSGMVGQILVEKLLNHPHYTEVNILVRKTQNISHPKLVQTIFDVEESDLSSFHYDHIFCCLGTTIAKAGSQEAFSKVDKEYPLTLGKAMINNGSSLFAIVTAGGANKNSSIFYNRIKGEVEEGLRQLGFKSLGIFRPSMLLGVRNEKRSIEKLGQRLMLTFDFLIPKRYKAIQAEKVAEAMIQFAIDSKDGVSIFESDQMQ
jgi:uncharacterized protein YbjT (DUF2867 family)